jgi:hypothetical protein
MEPSKGARHQGAAVVLRLWLDPRLDWRSHRALEQRRNEPLEQRPRTLPIVQEHEAESMIVATTTSKV